MNELIVILGYMGSGKSTIGKNLALKLDLPFVDLDHFIEETEQSTIKKIFENKGAIHFRKLERKALSQILESREPKVIALGGGTPCYYDNMELIYKNARSIYLKATIEELSRRLFKEKNQRPIISKIDDLQELREFIGKHLFERSYYYSQAHHTIHTNNQNIDDLTNRCLETLFQ
ncbi:MAG: shikimate kinase [Nonlabens sp.]